jgi:hypothetical protein
VVGELTIGYDTLTLASSPYIQVVTYLAEPTTPSADALDLLRSWTATPHAAQSSPGHEGANGTHS